MARSWHALALFSVTLNFNIWTGAYAQAQANNITIPISAPFYSRPDLNSIALDVTLYNKSLTTPGFIFLAPFQVSQPGPYIFDLSGNLVWTGWSVAGTAASHNFYVCQYSGSDHLCLYQGNQALGFARGQGLILDSSYEIVKSVRAGGGLPAADQHEFKLLNGGKSALMTVYNPVPYDLTDYNITDGQGWVTEGVFQEVDIESGDILFEWRSLNHVDVSAAYVLPNTTDISGNGITKDTPWDYFHINAVDKNAEGDYLVSGRHTETLYKISGQNGSILWQLGGKASSFELKNGLNFSYQHDCRFVSENSTTAVISLFDNASNGFNGSSLFTTGKIIAIDNHTMSASLVAQYGAPDPSGGLVSSSQGNMQLLDSGNVFFGWGSNAYVSEVTKAGEPAYYAHFATFSALHYRAYKFNFTSTPKDSPALYTYARNSSAPTTFYVSWNGATDVSSWRIFGGSSPEKLAQVGNMKKNGFETVTTYPRYLAYTIIEAITNNGTALRNSTMMKTFVPSSKLAAICTDIQCPLSDGTFIEPEIMDLSQESIAATTTATFFPSVASSTSTGSANSMNLRIPGVFAATSLGAVWLVLSQL